MRPLQVFALFAGVSAAFSWQGMFEDSAVRAVEGIEQVERLFKRQTDTAGTTAATSQTTTAKTTSKTTDKSTSSDTAKATGSNSAKATGSTKGSASGTITGSSAAASSTEVDPRSPAGGVSMITPNPYAGSQYYKIGDWVTFAWNFTSIINKPKAVNVYATCSTASAQWTIAANMSYQPTQTVLWDTNQYTSKATPQLVMATYTLLIENADEAKATALSNPGELGTVNQFMFGMYVPQPYVPWTEFNCPTCSAALSGKERQALGFMFAMISITILSFTWFSTGAFGLL
ncbi:uncharacterized protein PV09_01271 [Verruconis gallopava]|uniref:DUF7137 domain-containing protein n=1 Tax=Verruconis gallopava TaxID=253628 RepID=A0A0D2AP76_9PEZI|nr:uncharacterized protein PV09_01271 [Verruconis gallopava]KIW08355.1 hypothetical protein PV09_01271 [Verruconis gallopava]